MTTARTMSQRQGSAVKVYAQDLEAASPKGSPSGRLAAQDALDAARAVLTPREVAILKVFIGGRPVADVAAAAGRSASEMEDLLLSASTKLADYYETCVVAPS